MARVACLSPTDLVDALLEGVHILSPEWRYLYLNEAVIPHGRKTRAEVLGRTMLECYPGIEHTPLFAVLERCMRERIAETIETEFTYEDGGSSWFEARIQPYHDGLAILSIDITERKRIEQMLRETYKLRVLGQMASGVAHDLNNLLNPIALRLDLLRRRLAGDAEAERAIEQISALVKCGADTVTRLRDYGRTSSPTDVAQLQIDGVAREAIGVCQPRAQAAQPPVSIIEELGAPAEVSVSGSELLSALVNLIINAIEALPRGGHVTVRTGQSNESVWVEVQDDGIGMSAEVQANAGIPFFTTKGEAGTGLGLATVQAFLQRNGGALKLCSAPDQGTSVSLLLPTMT